MSRDTAPSGVMHQRAVGGPRGRFDVATVLAVDKRFRVEAGFATSAHDVINWPSPAKTMASGTPGGTYAVTPRPPS